VGPCGACQALQTDVARSLDRKDIRARLAGQAGYDALFHSVAPGDGERESSR